MRLRLNPEDLSQQIFKFEINLQKILKIAVVVAALISCSHRGLWRQTVPVRFWGMSPVGGRWVVPWDCRPDIRSRPGGIEQNEVGPELLWAWMRTNICAQSTSGVASLLWEAENSLWNRSFPPPGQEQQSTGI